MPLESGLSSVTIMTNLERIISISKKLGLTHVGSNISCLPVLEEIYAKKKPDDIVILDNAHAHLAHLVVRVDKLELRRETITGLDMVTNLIEKYGIHCDVNAGCEASGGSLGHGIGIGIGYALADRTRDVYVIVSDGSMHEGSNWEALRIARDLNLTNIHIYGNFNGYTAVAPATESLEDDMRYLCHTRLDINIWSTDNGLPELEGLKGHYEKL